MRESLEPLVRRVRNEFVEMPGMSLTQGQAARLWQADPADVQDVLRTLVDAHFLTLHEGRYRRLGVV